MTALNLFLTFSDVSRQKSITIYLNSAMFYWLIQYLVKKFKHIVCSKGKEFT